MLEDFFNTIIEEDEYICGNKFIDFSNEKIVFCKTDFINEYSNLEIDTFITHNSDYHITKFLINNGPKFKKWYCQNKDVNNINLFSIPIGLENFEINITSKSKFGKYSSLPENGPNKKKFISKLSNNENDHKNLVYMNFNCSTRPYERNLIKNYFDQFNWVTKKQNVSWQEYYNDTINSKFVISPRGNGVDCHRIWESLYLRTIPIVLKEHFMYEFSELPILFIDSWSEITEEFLLQKYDEFKNKKFYLNKLKISSWKKIITEE